jgi:hypothetical protein
MIYRDLHASLLRFCVDFSQGCDPKPEFVNFDASGDENSLPKSDILGPLALSFELDEHILSGTVQLGFSTWDDTNLFRLVERVDAMLELLKPTSKLPIYDSTNMTSDVKGWIVIENGIRVMPVIKGDTRPIQFIAVKFSSTETFRL